MTKGILGKKVGMTQVFTDNGELVPVTVIDVTPNVVMQIKTVENDGYSAVQLGFDDKREVLSNKPEQGHAAKANTTPKRFIGEIRDAELGDIKVGDEVKADVFAEGETVDVTGTTKGHGYQGNIHKDNQSRGPMAHGSRYHRRPGSMGPVDPARVFKQKKLPGQTGGNVVTIQNLQIVKVDTERNLLLVKGNVPGSRKSLVTVQAAVKKSK